MPIKNRKRKTNSPVDHEWEQAVAMLRECAERQGQSFERNVLFARIGVDPYNAVRRNARMVKRTAGFLECIERKEIVQVRTREGDLTMITQTLSLWRLCAHLKGRKRAQIVRLFKSSKP